MFLVLIFQSVVCRDRPGEWFASVHSSVTLPRGPQAHNMAAEVNDLAFLVFCYFKARDSGLKDTRVKEQEAGLKVI